MKERTTQVFVELIYWQGSISILEENLSLAYHIGKEDNKVYWTWIRPDSEEPKKPDYGDTELDKEQEGKKIEELRINQDFWPTLKKRDKL